jgi:hypothetical protein
MIFSQSIAGRFGLGDRTIVGAVRESTQACGSRSASRRRGWGIIRSLRYCSAKIFFEAAAGRSFHIIGGNPGRGRIA